MNVYCVADVQAVVERAQALPGRVELRPMTEADLPALAALYLLAYAPAVDRLEDAVAEMESAFDGTWGDLWRNASPVALADKEPVGFVQSVRRPSMDDAPDCPWLIEVVTHPGHRRAGLARALVGFACDVILAAGETRVGLTVDDTNLPALSLYRSLGFIEAE